MERVTGERPAMIEENPEVIAKRVAEMQQMTARGSTGDPPFSGELTIVWKQEKAEIMRRLDDLERYEVDAKRDILSRLDALELDVRDLQTKLQALLEVYGSAKARTV